MPFGAGGGGEEQREREFSFRIDKMLKTQKKQFSVFKQNISQSLHTHTTKYFAQNQIWRNCSGLKTEGGFLHFK